MRRGDRILVAVSGGADSVCLLHLFLQVREEYRLRLAVAHFDHRLRGRESSGDAAFVERLAGQHGLPFVLGRSRGAVRQARASAQETLRRERLDFLLTEARRRRYGRVALGHHADDQAETVLLRLLTEGGPAGLAGIPPVSHGGRIIHPLLDIRREDIEEHLRLLGVPWRTDRSNQGLRYLRNRVRHRLLPLLAAQYNPRISSRLAEVASLLRRDNALLDEISGQLLRAARRRRGGIFFPAALLRRAHPALLSRALLAALRELSVPGADFGSRHLEMLMAGSASPRFRLFGLPGRMIAARDGRGLTLAREGSRPPGTPFDSPLPAGGHVVLQGGKVRVTASVRTRPPAFDPASLAGIPWRAALDRDRVRLPLRVRSRRPGDRVRLLGAPGEKKLKDVLIDRKVPLPLRDRLPLVCDGQGIVWVAGVLPAHRCRVTARTGRVLLLRAEIDPSDLL